MEVKGYNQFVKEEFDELFKVYFVYDASSIDEGDISYKEYVGKKFMRIITKKALSYQLHQKMPVVNYNNDISRFLIENKLIPLENFYNRPDVVKSVYSKIKFHQTMEDSKFVPKTVFSKEDALEKLDFPIIAKPDNKHSGVGIQKFKLKEDLRESKENFDVFSEYKKIDEEFRLIFFKDKPLLCMKRKPLNIKAKSGKGDTNEDMVFAYQKVDSKYMPNEYGSILKEVRKNFEDVDFYALDVMKDNKGNKYIIEINSQPGMPFDAFVNLYHEVYKDFYKKEMSSESLNQLSIYASDLNMLTLRSSDNRFIIGS